MPIGTSDSPFGGRITGNGKMISGLYIDTKKDNQGLFGCISSDSYVKDINVMGSITSLGENIGGVVGLSRGEIANCMSAVSINSTGDNVGGVVGQTISSQVANSYSTMPVSGTATSVGGVVGKSNYIVSCCYFNSDNFAGEVVGNNQYYIYLREGKSSSEMRSEEFETLLEREAYDYNQEKPLMAACSWIYSTNGGYPTLNNGVEPDSHNLERGTITNPYTISSVEELKQFAEKSNNGLVQEGEYYLLTKDIDLQGSVSNQWTPIGTANNNFWDVFDGGGNTIRGLYIDSQEDYQALFGYLGRGGVITNLVVEGSVSSSGKFTAGIVAQAEGRSHITYCTNNVAVSSVSWGTGGVVAQCEGVISYCTNNGDISGANTTGGVVGEKVPYSEDDAVVEACYITHCHNTGDITGKIATGGVMGASSRSPISYCSNRGKVDGESFVGGVGGYAWSLSTVHNCFNTGDVDADRSASGITDCGGAKPYENCYNTGNITSTQSSGITSGAETFVNSYNTGKISGITSSSSSFTYSGALVGLLFTYNEKFSPYILNSYFLEGSYPTGCGYYDSYLSEELIIDQSTELTDDEMRQSSFVDKLNAGQSPAIWKADYTSNPINNGYPIFVWQ